jgi:hypothetical protein
MAKLKRLLSEMGIDPEVLERATDEQLMRLAIPFMRSLEREIIATS